MSNYYAPRPAVLVGSSRSGSTFLLHCLDSHPEIGCERVDPLNPLRNWSRHMRNVPECNLLKALWARPGYGVAMFKLSYKQVAWVGLNFLKEHKPHIIHLHRSNPLRVYVSSVINTASIAGEMNHPTHSLEPVTEVTTVRLEPEKLLRRCRRYIRKVKKMRKRLKSLGLPIMVLTYEHIIGGEGEGVTHLKPEAREKVCDFLGVQDRHPMFSLTRRINPSPLSEIVENWGEVEAAVKGSEFARFLTDE